MISQYPTLFAHRGASGYTMENTISAMVCAKQCGATWVEFDVMLAKCGTPIVFHDENLRRLAQNKAKIINMTYQELKQVTLNHPNKTEKYPIATLQEMLECLVELNLNANIEIKPLPEQDILTTDIIWKLAKQYQKKINIIFSSFSYQSLQHLRAIAPTANIALLMRRWQLNWTSMVDTINACAIHLKVNAITQKRVTAIKNKGLFVAVYTVNQLPIAQQLYAMDVDALFSDYPDKILAIN